MKNPLSFLEKKKYQAAIDKIQSLIDEQAIRASRFAKAGETILHTEAKIKQLRASGKFEDIEVAREIVTLGEQHQLAIAAHRANAVDSLSSAYHGVHRELLNVAGEAAEAVINALTDDIVTRLAGNVDKREATAIAHNTQRIRAIKQRAGWEFLQNSQVGPIASRFPALCYIHALLVAMVKPEWNPQDFDNLPA